MRYNKLSIAKIIDAKKTKFYYILLLITKCDISKTYCFILFIDKNIRGGICMIKGNVSIFFIGLIIGFFSLIILVKFRKFLYLKSKKRKKDEFKRMFEALGTEIEKNK